MPELPEVETVVRGLRQPLIGRTVQGMWYDTWLRTIHSPDPEQFAARIVGQTFRAINRRAKYILCQLDHDILVVHLKMTGRLYVVPDDAVSEADRWLHFSLQLDNGTQLRFSDARKFGFVSLTPTFDQIAPASGAGAARRRFHADVLRERLARHGKSIKALLLDQAFLAGVGNIYADEALYRAKISPLRPANRLTDGEIRELIRRDPRRAQRRDRAGRREHQLVSQAGRDARRSAESFLRLRARGRTLRALRRNDRQNTSGTARDTLLPGVPAIGGSSDGQRPTTIYFNSFRLGLF